MAKIVEYDDLENIQEDDLLLVDGPQGTHKITIEKLLQSELFEKVIDDIVSEKIKERIGNYTFHEPPLTQQQYDDMEDHGTEHDIYIVLEDEG